MPLTFWQPVCLPMHHGGTMLVKLVMLVVLLVTMGDVLPALAQLEGAQVTQIFVRTHTANEGNAETNADIYLEYAGRELNVDNPREGGSGPQPGGPVSLWGIESQCCESW